MKVTRQQYDVNKLFIIQKEYNDIAYIGHFFLRIYFFFTGS